MQNDKLVRFDWAIKHLLHDESNSDILEGFVSALLKEEIRVVTLLEADTPEQVALLVEGEDSEQLILAIQAVTEDNFPARLVTSTAKLIAENPEQRFHYQIAKKVITININYGSLGEGDDYLYHGVTNFLGFNQEFPEASSRDHSDRSVAGKASTIYPEHYLIRLGHFNNEIKSDFDQWVYMLKNNEVKPEFQSHNIQIAAEKLRITALDDAMQQAFWDDMGM